LHGALSGYVAHLLAVVALRFLVTLGALTGKMVMLAASVTRAVAGGAVARQVANSVAVVALAVVHTSIRVGAVAGQVSGLSTAEARAGAHLRAVALDVAGAVAVVARTGVNLLVALLGNVAKLVALVATVHIHLALAGIVTHTVTLVTLLS